MFQPKQLKEEKMWNIGKRKDNIISPTLICFDWYLNYLYKYKKGIIFEYLDRQSRYSPVVIQSPEKMEDNNVKWLDRYCKL